MNSVNSVTELGEVKKRKIGRPSKYNENYVNELLDFFDVEPTKTIIETVFNAKTGAKEIEKEIANSLPTIEGFCRKVKISKSTFHAWVEEYSEFREAYDIAKTIQVSLFQINGLAGRYHPIFSIFFAKNCLNWKDKQEIETNSSTIDGTELKMSPEQRDLRIQQLLEKIKT